MVKAAIKSKGKPMKLEGDMILGTTVLYDSIRNSEAFIVGDVKHSILPGVLARTTVAILKGHFSEKELEKAYADFHTLLLAAMAATWEDVSNEEETGKEN